jgi:mycothione reductase
MPHYDLVIVGTGSGNSIPGPEVDGWSIAIVESGTFGGTCLNVGCIPTKMYVYPADLAQGARGAARLGVFATVDRVDWKAMRDRIFGRIDPIAAGGRAYREGPECPNVTVYAGTGTFTGLRRMAVHLADGGTAEITADRWVIAAGSRAVVPDIPGLAGSRYHTSDTIMRIDDLPRRMVIMGGGYIAAEFGHVFSAFGCEVIQLTRSDLLLRHQDADISAAFTAQVARRYDLRRNTVVEAVRTGDSGGDSVVVQTLGPDGPQAVEADALLVATGRTPNGDRLGVGATGVELDTAGRVVVDEFQRTGVEGIWALGDVSSRWQLKHVANHEARVVAHNLTHPDDLVAADHRFVPAAVFADPQVASVGLTEAEAVRRGIRYVVTVQRYADIAAGWAREDTDNICKLIADPASGLILGCHIVGPEAATLIQPVIQAMSFAIPARGLARAQYWIHPALPELIENALLGLPLDPAPTAPATR